MEWLEQLSDQAGRSWLYLTQGKVLAVVFGIVFALIAVGLLILSRTKWGRAKPLTKFVVVSVLLHVWLLMYAVGSRRILPQGNPDGSQSSLAQRSVSVEFESAAVDGSATLDDSVEAGESSAAAEGTLAANPWEAPIADESLPMPPGLDAAQSSLDLASDLESFQPMAMPELPPEPVAQEPTLPPPEQTVAEVMPPVVEQRSTDPLNADRFGSEDRLGDAGRMQESLAEDPVYPPDASQLVQQQSANRDRTRPAPNPNLPAEYQLRQAPNRLQAASAFGADGDSEAAVQAGLRWLAGAQSPRGYWDAAAYGAGTETYALNKDRYKTGETADTAITGLALLAFLSAGHTHQAGDYQANVRRGLEFLIDSQMPSGDMSGPKQVGRSNAVVNSRMYCHAISMLALAEAYAMTRDDALRESLLKATRYTINAQDTRGGGWRYLPQSPGDLSLFGWQAMALKSVARSGIQIPLEVQRRMQFFVNSCSTGRYGGLAKYMPREERPTATMTAEALACRLLLDFPLTEEATREAKSLILSELPGTGTDNVYFWYYATLALFQLQDSDWSAWNLALKRRLLETQRPVYDAQAGSWDPDRIWGGYGGRVYSTAISCLCLEVYYRYLPLYGGAQMAQQRRPLQR
ncbi:MAG: hypothetical protein AB8B50_14310 [Pirellulaceae bacterium]